MHGTARASPNKRIHVSPDGRRRGFVSVMRRRSLAQTSGSASSPQSELGRAGVDWTEIG